MKAHSRSDSHSHATQAMLAAKRAVVDGTVVQQLQNVEAHKMAQNRAAMKCLILLTNFLTKEDVARSTKFEKLVDVVVRCGSQQLKQYLETAPRNATYTSRVAVVEFIESLGTWVKESILKRLQKAAMYSLMADECTDIANVEELSVFCLWEEGGVPVECPLKKADAETIYSTLIECLKKKNLQVGRISDWDLMELQLFLDEGPVLRHVSRNTLLMLCLYTATVIYCSWLVCNLPIKFLALLMFTEH